MKRAIAELFRLLFRLPYMKKAHYGIYKRFFRPLDLFRGVTREVRFHGIKLVLHLDDWIQQNIFFLGSYEPAELKVLEKLLPPKGTFMDIGANMGLYSLLASRTAGPEGTVYCFEPLEKNYKMLKNNIAINRLSNIHSEKLAIGEKNKTTTLYYDDQEKNQGMATTRYIKDAYREEITMVSLDEYVNNHAISRIHLIKIDIEGSEYAALLGMRNTLSAHRPAIIIEILDSQTGSANATRIHALLHDMGYQKYFISDRGELCEHEACAGRHNYVFLPGGSQLSNKS